MATNMLNDIDRGDSVTSAVTFHTTAGALGNPDDVTYFVIDPTGPASETAYVYGTAAEVARPSTGVYVLTLPITMSGVWLIRCVGEGAISQVVRGSVVAAVDPFS